MDNEDFIKVPVDGAFYLRHPSAVISPSAVIRPFSIIAERATIDANAKIGSHCFIGPHVKIGESTNIQGHCFIPRGVFISNHVFIGPSVTFTNCKHPSSTPSKSKDFIFTSICNNVVIGAHATILPGITIYQHVAVGAGAVVTTDLTSTDFWHVGNPARPILCRKKNTQL